MIVDQIKDAAGLEKVGDDLTPAPQIAQPGQHAIGAEDDLKLTAQPVRQVLNIGADKGRRNAELATERLRQRNRAIGEIDASDKCAFARPGEGVEPEVALQMQQRATSHIGQLAAAGRAQAALSGLEAGQIAEEPIFRDTMRAMPWPRPGNAPSPHRGVGILHRWPILDRRPWWR